MISKEQYLRLYEALWKVNGLSKPVDKEEPIAFLEYMGHTNTLRLRVFEDGWVPFANPTFQKDFEVGSEDANEDIEDCIKALEDLAKVNEEYHLRKVTKADEKSITLTLVE